MNSDLAFILAKKQFPKYQIMSYLLVFLYVQERHLKNYFVHRNCNFQPHRAPI